MQFQRFAVERSATCMCDRSATQNIGYPSPKSSHTWYNRDKVYVARLINVYWSYQNFFCLQIDNDVIGPANQYTKLWKMMAKLINKQVNYNGVNIQLVGNNLEFVCIIQDSISILRQANVYCRRVDFKLI